MGSVKSSRKVRHTNGSLQLPREGSNGSASTSNQQDAYTVHTTDIHDIILRTIPANDIEYKENDLLEAIYNMNLHLRKNHRKNSIS